jgi:GntR family transcriptional regulator, transcriptional repressor for pyruvate dehydrogenase complex
MIDSLQELRQIKPQKASDLIVEEIWKMILAGKLKPGDKLPPEHKLVERFGVSKVTLREALQTLENYGHITRKRGTRGGSVVLDIAPTQGISLIATYMSLTNLTVDRLMEARLLVEPLIARLAAERIDAAGEARLRELLALHETDLAEHGGSKRGWEFYILVAELSGNSVLKVIEELLIRLFMDAEFALSIGDIGMSSEEIDYNAEVLKANTAIAEALFTRAPERAAEAVSETLKGFAERIARYSAHRPALREVSELRSGLI